MAGNRTWLAVLLAVVQPGLGHVYLREWLRAVLWAGLFVSAVLVLFPEPSSSAGIVESSQQMVQEASPAALATAAVVVVGNAVDAGLLASGWKTDHSTDGNSCPNCGEELDEDLDFCPWCTTRLDAPEESE